MYGLEKKLYEQLVKLKDQYGLKGIKVEFEAEGSSFRDLLRIRRLTARAGVDVYIKIGGVEAVRDIKDSLEIGVDGIIAPMVESVFGASKFIEAYEKIYKNHLIDLTLNIETVNGLKEIDGILDFSKEKISNITIGRTDLSGSFMDTNITPDSPVIYDKLLEVGGKVKNSGLGFTVGGSVSAKTIGIMQAKPEVRSLIANLETRKVMLPIDEMLKPGAIQEALKFEELYILSKKEISDLFMESEVKRLTQLQGRM